MLIVGLAGGANLPHEDTYDFQRWLLHDSAAVVVRDGRVVAGVEQERIDRIKHSNKAPMAAMRRCLEECGACLRDVDALAFYMTEESCDFVLKEMSRENPRAQIGGSVRNILAELVASEFGRRSRGKRFRLSRTIPRTR